MPTAVGELVASNRLARHQPTTTFPVMTLGKITPLPEHLTRGRDSPRPSTEEQRAEALDLAFTLICDGWGTWEKDARAALVNPETPADDRAAIA